MYTLISVLIDISCILLIIAVLIQNSQGGGLASGFSASNQIMGVRRTADFLEKFTWGLAIGLVALSLLAGFVLPKHSEQQSGSAIQEQIDNAAAPSQNIPVPPSQHQEQPAQK